MNMTVTKKGKLGKAGQIDFKESSVNDSINKLDASGWVVRDASQTVPDNGVLVTLSGNNKTLAAAIVVPAEKSQFQQTTQLSQEALANSIYLSDVWVSPDAVTSNALPAILYLALRRGRIMGRQDVVALIQKPNTNVPLAALLQLDRLSNVEEIERDGYTLVAVAQRLKYSILHIYKQCSDDELGLIKENFITELLEIHRNWMDRFYHGAWAQSILNGTLKKEQYIYSLYNLHQYVRQTTRLCARCVAHSDNLNLRNHYINHFKGEINHELLIEHDLKTLSADLEYLHESHVPHPATKEFMMVQESTIGYYQDPILMLACPMAAEGIAAHMDEHFIDKLHQTIGSWGIEKPEEAARFLTSHIRTDGGEDGHWLAVVSILKKALKDEHYQQQFLSVLTAAMNGFERGFNMNVTDMKLWNAMPKGRAQ